jgi:hypothetical protein
MRDIEIIDSELRLVAALRRAEADRGGPLPSIDVADALLDERRELTGSRPRYAVLSTTVAPGALVCTDLTPLAAAAFVL